MKKYYYTIIRKYYGINYSVDISEEEDCFIFNTETEAKQCLKSIFNNGDWMEDERYGKVRYYIEQVRE